jgi:hypothetical protein
MTREHPIIADPDAIAFAAVQLLDARRPRISREHSDPFQDPGRAVAGQAAELAQSARQEINVQGQRRLGLPKLSLDLAQRNAFGARLFERLANFDEIE